MRTKEIEISIPSFHESNTIHPIILAQQTRGEVRYRIWLTLGTLSILVCFIGLIFQGIIRSVWRYREYGVLALLIFVPMSFFYFSYAANAIVTNIFTIFNPMHVLTINSKYYSAIQTILTRDRITTEIKSPYTPSRRLQKRIFRSVMSMGILHGNTEESSPSQRSERSSAQHSPSMIRINESPKSRIESSGMSFVAHSLHQISKTLQERGEGSFYIRGLLRCETSEPPEYSDMSKRSYSYGSEQRKGIKWPPVVVHMPVYKEDFREVIIPSCESIFAAMDEYMACGGECRFLISDDGLQCISEEMARERIEYYRLNGITYVARPPAPRPGKFKKASNMNYTYRWIEEFQTKGGKDEWMIDGKGEGEFRIEKDAILLLLDADTRVPKTCIIDTIPEFMEYPELPYTQHFTMPFPIAEKDRYDYWLALISYFTENIYRIGIGFSTALGGCCPLVGHNAFLRYASIKEVGYWSEDSVCEDFDMFLRLAGRGQYGRYVMYTGTEFQEGVSLTFMDEVVKFQKFTYGACEMCFRPFRYWCMNGPFSESFWAFLRSPLNWHSKWNVLFYVSTYFAMANAFYFAVADAFLGLYFTTFYDRYMARSFDVMFGCIAVFAGLSTISKIAFNIRFLRRPRIGYELQWILPMALVFSGMMFHMTDAAFRYMFSIPMIWGATKKGSIVKVGLVRSLWGTIYHFRWMYMTLLLVLVTYSYVYATHGSRSIYRSWSIYYYITTHMIAPLVYDSVIVRGVGTIVKRISGGK